MEDGCEIEGEEVSWTVWTESQRCLTENDRPVGPQGPRGAGRTDFGNPQRAGETVQIRP